MLGPVLPILVSSLPPAPSVENSVHLFRIVFSLILLSRFIRVRTDDLFGCQQERRAGRFRHRPPSSEQWAPLGVSLFLIEFDFIRSICFDLVLVRGVSI